MFMVNPVTGVLWSGGNHKTSGRIPLTCHISPVLHRDSFSALSAASSDLHIVSWRRLPKDLSCAVTNSDVLAPLSQILHCLQTSKGAAGTGRTLCLRINGPLSKVSTSGAGAPEKCIDVGHSMLQQKLVLTPTREGFRLGSVIYLLYCPMPESSMSSARESHVVPVGMRGLQPQHCARAWDMQIVG